MKGSVASLAAIVCAALLALFGPMTIGVAVLIGAMAGFAIYAALNVPGRYRWFGWGQNQEAVDNAMGQFGKTYPEDHVESDKPSSHVSRNEPCPCGSGKKFKQCHGRTS